MLTRDSGAGAGSPRATLPQLDGVAAINKPSGPTSAACLRLFKKLGQKKIGHAGSLDPLASGVLIVLLGQATKLSSWIMGAGHKVYRGEIRLGLATDTWDILGAIVSEGDCSGISEERVREEAALLEGEREQIVPAYSAAKHNGQPLYKLARKGIAAPEKSKVVNFYRISILDVSLPYVTFRAICGSGAYIRSLAHSLGTRLGCGAALSKLEREYSYPFGLESALDPDELRDDPESLARRALPLDKALPDWEKIPLTPLEAARVRQGVPTRADPPRAEGQMAFLCEGGSPLAIARCERGKWLVARGLWN